jgi:hypothetical protein
MKSLATFALVVLFCVPARAQFGGMGGGGGIPATQAQSIETQLLEMEQEADKMALKDALLLQARQGMEPKSERQDHIVVLRDFIAKKKDAISNRDAELKKLRSSRTVAATAGRKQPQFDLQASIESSEKARIESQLLQAQVNLLEPELSKAIDALAAAEHEANKDEKQRSKADDARKVYEKIKAQYVEHSKKLRLEQQQSGGMGGMIGMGGMGGGMR